MGVPDVARAQAFYGHLLGWDFDGTGQGAAVSTQGIDGGIHEDRPSIQIFYSVSDIDEAVRRVIDLGGEVDEGSSEGPAGRYVHSCRDDQGVPFGLHQPVEENA